MNRRIWFRDVDVWLKMIDYAQSLPDKHVYQRQSKINMGFRVLPDGDEFIMCNWAFWGAPELKAQAQARLRTLPVQPITL